MLLLNSDTKKKRKKELANLFQNFIFVKNLRTIHHVEK